MCVFLGAAPAAGDVGVGVGGWGRIVLCIQKSREHELLREISAAAFSRGTQAEDTEGHA